MNKLQQLKNTKKTENGDVSFKSTNNELLDILFTTEYLQNHLSEVRIGNSEKEKLLSMFIRDPRHGLGKRDLGRELMTQSGVLPQDIVKAGRFDDLFANPTDESLKLLYNEIESGNHLAKKWCPRLGNKDNKLAIALASHWKMSRKEYRKFIKCDDTVEYKLTYHEKGDCETPLDELFNNSNVVHPLVDTIKFESVPSQAMVKYYNAFKTRDDTKDRFEKYLEDVKSGEKDLKVSTTSVYDIYQNKNKIDPDLFFEKIEKIKINCLPIIDTSASMFDSEDSMGKALSIGHYLSKCSTYCNSQVVAFSNDPYLITLGEPMRSKYHNEDVAMRYLCFSNTNDNSQYKKEILSMFTGDITRTDFGKVMRLLEDLNDLPDYLVVLSDMEFDYGSNLSKEYLQELWKINGYTTKIVWWNFNSRNVTMPETDEMGNIFLSGYNPMLLKYLESGFDGNKFLDKLLNEYSKFIQ